MTISADRKIASIESETTYGTDAISPGPPSDWYAFRACDIMPVVNPIESPRATASASGERHCVLESHNDVSWEMPLSGKTGAAGTAPAYDALLAASGFKKSVVASTSVTYRPTTVNDMTDTPSATIWLYKYRLTDSNAYLLKAFGYRGNVTMTMTMGEEAVIAGTGMALYSAYPTSTVAKPTAPTTYLGAGCMVVEGMSLTVGATSYPVESFEIQSNWTMTEIRTGASTGGTLSQVLLTRPMSGGRLIGSLTLVDGATAFQDMITKWSAGTQATLSATLTNGVDTITITAPNVQFGQPAESAEGILKFDVPIYFNRGTSGDDEISIAYT
jgi:hypothetical protein